MHDNGHLPFDIRLRRAIDARGLTLDRVAMRLADTGTPVSISTLSNWQRGKTAPTAASRRAVAQLEVILDLSTGDLASSLTPYGDVSREVPTRQGFGAFSAGRLRASFEAASDDVAIVRRDEYVVVRPHELRQEVHMTVRAERTGVDHTVIIVHPDVATGVEFTAGPACQLGATRQHDPAGLVAAELIFDAALTRGELYPVSYSTASPLGDDAGYIATWVHPGLASFSLTVEFDSAFPPASVYQIWRQTPDAPHKRLDDLRLIGNRWAHLWLHDPPPGTHGIRWEPAPPPT